VELLTIEMGSLTLTQHNIGGHDVKSYGYAERLIAARWRMNVAEDARRLVIENV
jgi:hypothetical protein